MSGLDKSSPYNNKIIVGVGFIRPEDYKNNRKQKR